MREVRLQVALILPFASTVLANGEIEDSPKSRRWPEVCRSQQGTFPWRYRANLGSISSGERVYKHQASFSNLQLSTVNLQTRSQCSTGLSCFVNES